MEDRACAAGEGVAKSDGIAHAPKIQLGQCSKSLLNYNGIFYDT